MGSCHFCIGVHPKVPGRHGACEVCFFCVLVFFFFFRVRKPSDREFEALKKTKNQNQKNIEALIRRTCLMKDLTSPPPASPKRTQLLQLARPNSPRKEPHRAKARLPRRENMPGKVALNFCDLPHQTKLQFYSAFANLSNASHLLLGNKYIPLSTFHFPLSRLSAVHRHDSECEHARDGLSDSICNMFPTSHLQDTKHSRRPEIEPDSCIPYSTVQFIHISTASPVACRLSPAGFPLFSTAYPVLLVHSYVHVHGSK
jgi:hypothetical protein